jgi:hypothetical protein
MSRQRRAGIRIRTPVFKRLSIIPQNGALKARSLALAFAPPLEAHGGGSAPHDRVVFGPEEAFILE